MIRYIFDIGSLNPLYELTFKIINVCFWMGRRIKVNKLNIYFLIYYKKEN